MYFKSLELFGFKSFADRTRLDFEPGVTAVVGPNGCGKSNIADSIKWVLGEQSAKVLRGGKMEDVIFNGTDGKEPVSFAEVSLTLSNQDRILPIEYDEVTVTRRLYRSGESEYMLNKTPVRLKDISELFMGTGIGTSAYSLMEQGKMDQVISSRPEDRREIFEEASGITKYKAKKREALRRLEDTEQNLVRINDIIVEVKRQINSIERQAKKAERYKDRYEVLKSLELKLSRIDLEGLSARFREANVNTDELKAREKSLEEELNATRASLVELNKERSQVETRRMELKSGIIETDSEISKAQDKILMDRERIEELIKRRADLESEILKSSESTASQEKEVFSLREKLSVMNKEDTERVALLKAKEARLDEISRAIKASETALSTSKANIVDIASRQAKLRNNMAKVSTTLSSHDSRLKRLETEKQTILEEKSGLEAKLNEAAAEAEAIEKEVSLLSSRKDEILKLKSDSLSRVESLENQLKEISSSLATGKSRLEMLEGARARHEGFSSGVKAILERPQGPERKGVRGSIANLLKVKRGYEKAIESALEKYLQAIVADDSYSIEDSINYLKTNSSGKVLFADAGYFNAKAGELKEAAALQDSRVLGRAIDFVSADPSYQNILRHVLSGVYIVKTLEDARSLLKDDPRGGVFITLDGETVQQGFVSGGYSLKDDLGLINRDARIQELSEEVAGLERQSGLLETERGQKEDEIKELERQIESTAADLSAKGVLLANAISRGSNIEENIKGVSDEISLANLEIDEVNSEIVTLRQEEESMTKTLSQIEEEARVNEERIKQNERLLVNYAREKEELIVYVTEQRTELGAFESKKEGLASTLGILESSLNDVKSAINSRRMEREASSRKIDELRAEIAELEQRVRSLSEGSSGKTVVLQEVEKAYSETLAKFSASESAMDQAERALDEVKSKSHGVDLKRTEVTYSMDNLKQRVRDVYKMELEEVVLPEDWRTVDRETLKKEAEESRSGVEAMGTVNLVAIEENRELQDRFVFLTNQRDDLMKAKDSLLKAIDKINKTTKELFIETFKNIQVEFRNFFKMLFGGGDGELVLLDDGNVLECGIDIVARPPGKRLQNVSLLSGGEKALTAVSLLFAIFKVKPSPFCVLDEIDAPLDESNVDRFARSLDMFTNTSQFIVITHNKKTIDKADVMYGITMQQSGVSKVVSVKFSDAKKQETVGQV
ncbi:MAG: chromosome segregation protein SMC [Candidatus Omnitrophota bacterium]